MKKRLCAILAALLILTALLPLSALAAEESTAVAKEYDRFAASIAQADAHNGAVTQLISHSLHHPNEALAMDEEDAFTAAMVNSVLFRRYATEALNAGLQIMEEEGTDRVLIGATNMAWHDYAYHYRLIMWDDYDTENPILDNCSRMLTENVYYTGKTNQNDSAMVLVVGNAESYMRIYETASDLDRTTYRVEIMVYDRFDFDTDYSDELEAGFDISNSVLISMLGAKYLNPFDWSVQMSFDLTIADHPFTDVTGSDWFCSPVIWAAEHDVTKGKTETTFAPYDSCTRAQVVTFLWAAAGRPEPVAANHPFTDIAPEDWYYKPVLWAVDRGITGGVSPTEFGPDQSCTRAQIATFLWAAAGKFPVSSLDGFTDVTAGDWFATPVIWAKEQGITDGVGGGRFAPNDTCTRAQVVTFLYKVYG